MITNKDKTKFKLISKKETLDIIKKPKKSETYKYRKLFNGDEELICLMSPEKPKSVMKKDKNMNLENKLFTFLNDFKQDINSQLNEINNRLDKIKNHLNDHIQDFENFKTEMYKFKNKIESLPTIQKEFKFIK